MHFVAMEPEAAPGSQNSPTQESESGHLIEILEQLKLLTKAQKFLGQELTLRLDNVEDMVRDMRNDFKRGVDRSSNSTLPTFSEAVLQEYDEPMFAESGQIVRESPLQETPLEMPKESETRLDGVVLEECERRSQRISIDFGSRASKYSLLNDVDKSVTLALQSHTKRDSETLQVQTLNSDSGCNELQGAQLNVSFSLPEAKDNVFAVSDSQNDLWIMTQQRSADIGSFSTRAFSAVAERLRRSVLHAPDTTASRVSRVSQSFKRSILHLGSGSTDNSKWSTNDTFDIDMSMEPPEMQRVNSNSSEIDASDSARKSYDSRDSWMASCYHLMPCWERMKETALHRESESDSEEDAADTHLPDCIIWNTKPLYRRQGVTHFSTGSNPAKCKCTPRSISKCMRTSLERVIISPYSFKRTLWDLSSMLLMAYDVVVVPMQTFEMPADTFTITVGWCALLFWTCDMPLSFVTAYDDTAENRIEKAPFKVLTHYMQTWFIFDIICLVPDWISVAYGADDVEEMAGVGRTVKILKGLRALRLLRLVKVRKAILKFEKRFNNDYMMCYLNVLKLMLTIAVLVHYLACGFKGVSDLEGSIGWAERAKYADTETGYLYLTSLHWALSQFQGSSDVFPTTITERAYAVVVLYLGVVVAAAFISSITNSMTRIQQIYSTKNNRKWILMRYLDDNNISGVLSMRVKMFVDSVIKEERTRAGEVEILALLPEDLRTDLELESKGPVFSMHPLLWSLTQNNVELAKKLSCAIVSVRFSTTDLVFERGAPGDRVYVVMSGKLLYTARQMRRAGSGFAVTMRRTKSMMFSWSKRAKRSRSRECLERVSGLSFSKSSMMEPLEEEEEVHVGSVMAEMSLWSRWEFQGYCSALTLADVCHLGALTFQEAIVQHPDQCLRVIRYAERYIMWMNEDHAGKWFNDLSSPVTRLEK